MTVQENSKSFYYPCAHETSKMTKKIMKNFKKFIPFLVSSWQLPIELAHKKYSSGKNDQDIDEG